MKNEPKSLIKVSLSDQTGLILWRDHNERQIKRLTFYVALNKGIKEILDYKSSISEIQEKSIIEITTDPNIRHDVDPSNYLKFDYAIIEDGLSVTNTPNKETIPETTTFVSSLISHLLENSPQIVENAIMLSMC